ncbi:uncharacterized protein LOC110737301 [Chenopodium quinoa]|uniref:uncharacterized protein LOC110737301 n=1 Tax=Chenopodium quinoa TaxID=63459 RepID=UPI000B777A65|nr:uncharacterized protein LOC110737301 [Chenopodium quinoa]
MKILSWNCHGIGNPWTDRALQDRCWRDRPNVVFVMESMIDEKRLNKIKNKCGYIDGVCLSSVGKSGGLGMWWKDVKANVVSYSVHHFAIDVLDNNNCAMWRTIGIYGWPEQNNKHLTWSLRYSLKASCNLPCIMFGDFNEIMSMSEKEGGVPRGDRLMDDFREAMDNCALRDLGFKGSVFTWERGNSMETFVRERLDRFAADDDWCNLFPDFEVRNMPIFKSHSDHAQILLSTEKKRERHNVCSAFKFEALWLSQEECGSVVAQGWSDSAGLTMARRVAVCGVKLASWAALTFGSVKKRIKEGEEKLKELKTGVMDGAKLEECNSIAIDLEALYKLEESYWYARARLNELRDGDKNTKYFHHKASQRKVQNRIKGLFDENGEWFEERADLERLISAYFSNLFATSSPTGF